MRNLVCVALLGALVACGGAEAETSACSAAGASVDEAVDDGCAADFVTLVCRDGRELRWNDEVYGYTGGVWRRHGDGPKVIGLARTEWDACNPGSVAPEG